MVKIFHVSEAAEIALFEPRPTPYVSQPVVWAIAESHLAAYLAPRDCPRITFYANAQTSAADKARFLGHSQRVMAIPQRWYERLRRTTLYLYELPAAPFTCHDPIAGYYVAECAVRPRRITRVDDVVGALLARGVELRLLASLLPLRDAVVASSLACSIIRWRNVDE
ncbi:MAG: hypothetical protein KDD73_12480 [Anaerolineales bacterium]|nr:hypothetical protein [Anaerolineales bacterium]MCB9127982.1 hypothetical protein [Ardenticatenales bacterium]MCB9171998.1 hypothetical protein [Ardenticatenales bacterium]